MIGIDVSVSKEELRDTLALAAGYGGAEVQVGETGTTRNGLGLTWVRCPPVGARKLAQAGKVALAWSIARVEAIAKRPLQCFKCMDLGHVRATCVSTIDRSHLCYRYGETGHRARGCTASTPKCPLCESLGPHAADRMGGMACCPPKKENRRMPSTRDSAARKCIADPACAEGGAMDLVR